MLSTDDTRAYIESYEYYDYTLSENWDGTWDVYIIMDSETGEETNLENFSSCHIARKKVRDFIDQYVEAEGI